MNRQPWAILLASLAIAPLGWAAVSVQEQSQTTTNAAGEVRTETVQNMAGEGGTLVPWRQDNILSRQTKPGVTETTHEIRQRDRRGNLQLEARQSSTTTTIPGGTLTQSTEHRRDAAGRLVLSQVSEQSTQKTPTGLLSTKVERAPDINGQLVQRREITTETSRPSPTDQTTETRVRAFDPVAGQFRLVSVETTRVKREGNTTKSETETRAPGNEAGPGRVVSRSVTTSQVQAGGAEQRETIVYGLGQSGLGSSTHEGQLRPQQRIVERVVQQPNGVSTVQREWFRRDVNNEWKPVTLQPSDLPPAF